MIVRKQDGAFLYATTDLATIRYRMDGWQPDAILYVVDHRQGLHFQQLFAVARLLGYDQVEFQHVSFGTVLGEDGRPFRTRAGDTVGLEGLLDEAVARAAAIVAANDDAKPDGPELSAAERAAVAETVGIAALKYADLSQNRTSDYVFSYDKMLAMNGNTATYMQYAYARVRSIFARGKVDIDALRASPAPILLDSPAERALALELLRFGEALDLALADYRPNQLTGYLFDLANRYSTFFEQCHVLRAESDALRHSRLLLVRPDRADDPEGPRSAGHPGGGEDVGEQGPGAEGPGPGSEKPLDCVEGAARAAFLPPSAGGHDSFAIGGARAQGGLYG